jgi:hypothetical protein
MMAGSPTCNKKDFGKTETTIFRPVLSFNPTDDIRVLLRWEHTDSKGQGRLRRTTPTVLASSRHGPTDRDSFDFSIDNEGLSDFETDLVTMEVNWDVVRRRHHHQHPGLARLSIDDGWGYRCHPAVGFSTPRPGTIQNSGAMSCATTVRLALRMSLPACTGSTTRLITMNAAIAGGRHRQCSSRGDSGWWWRLRVDSLAGFFALDYNLTEEWKATGGVRYTAEDKRLISHAGHQYQPAMHVTEGTCPSTSATRTPGMRYPASWALPISFR